MNEQNSRYFVFFLRKKGSILPKPFGSFSMYHAQIDGSLGSSNISNVVRLLGQPNRPQYEKPLKGGVQTGGA